jgi:hypothetical protein
MRSVLVFRIAVVRQRTEIERLVVTAAVEDVGDVDPALDNLVGDSRRMLKRRGSQSLIKIVARASAARNKANSVAAIVDSIDKPPRGPRLWLIAKTIS